MKEVQRPETNGFLRFKNDLKRHLVSTILTPRSRTFPSQLLEVSGIVKVDQPRHVGVFTTLV